MRKFLALTLLLGLLYSTTAFAQNEYPYVTDEAGILSSSVEERLTRQLDEYEKQTTNEVAVVTVVSLGDEAIEDVVTARFRKMKIGREGVDNGVLFLIAPNDKLMFIAPGPGLEGALPDATCNRIIENTIVPYFRVDDFEGGIEAGIDAILDHLGDETPEQRQKRLAYEAQLREERMRAILNIFLMLGFVGGLLFLGRLWIRHRREKKAFFAYYEKRYHDLMEQSEYVKRLIADAYDTLRPSRYESVLSGLETKRSNTYEQLMQNHERLPKSDKHPRYPDKYAAVDEYCSLEPLENIRRTVADLINEFATALQNVNEDLNRAEQAIASGYISLAHLRRDGFVIDQDHESVMRGHEEALLHARKVNSGSAAELSEDSESHEHPDPVLAQDQAQTITRQVKAYVSTQDYLRRLYQANAAKITTLLSLVDELNTRQPKVLTVLEKLEEDAPLHLYEEAQGKIQAIVEEHKLNKCKQEINAAATENDMEQQNFSEAQALLESVDTDLQSIERWFDQPDSIATSLKEAADQVPEVKENIATEKEGDSSEDSLDDLYQHRYVKTSAEAIFDEGKALEQEAIKLEETTPTDWIRALKLYESALEKYQEFRKKAQSQIKRAKKRKRKSYNSGSDYGSNYTNINIGGGGGSNYGGGGGGNIGGVGGGGTYVGGGAKGGW